MAWYLSIINSNIGIKQIPKNCFVGVKNAFLNCPPMQTWASGRQQQKQSACGIFLFVLANFHLQAELGALGVLTCSRNSHRQQQKQAAKGILLFVLANFPIQAELDTLGILACSRGSHRQQQNQSAKGILLFVLANFHLQAGLDMEIRQNEKGLLMEAWFCCICGASGSRTHDLLHAMQAL